jgi:7,8-dihydropterin-6-yl-methyl-4-(beta-D-ribofuranosyl)aminobenzene 5'-phosphate synthase
MRFFGIRRGIVRKILLIIIIVIISLWSIIPFVQARGEIVKIVTLIEDTKINEPKDIVAAYGLSLYIERNGQKMLFDTGPSSQFVRNSEQLGVDLKKIDVAIISHTHMDHIGGLASFLWMNKKANIYLSRNALRNQDFRALCSKMDEETFNRICFVDHSSEIAQDVFILTDIKGRYPVRDWVDHEIVLVIKSNRKLIVFSACSHGEILNIVGTVTRTFPNIYVRAVIGGFHLTGTAKYSVEQIGKEMLKYPIMKIYTCHCTGIENYRIPKAILGVKIEYISTGSKFLLF